MLWFSTDLVEGIEFRSFTHDVPCLQSPHATKSTIHSCHNIGHLSVPDSRIVGQPELP